MIEDFIKKKKPENFDKEFFKLDNKIYNMINDEIEDNDTCFFDNDTCSDDKKPIGSHLFQQNGVLSRIAINNYVLMFRRNFAEPYKTRFKVQNIESASKFNGFCHRHDNTVFLPIEKENADIRSKESVFLLTLRSFADEYLKQIWNLKKLKVEIEKIDSPEMREYFKYSSHTKETLQVENKECISELILLLDLYQEIKIKLLESYEENNYKIINSVEFFSSKKGIVFSTVMTIPFSRNEELLLCINILPVSQGSRIIFSFFDSDKEKLESIEPTNELLKGVLHPNLNRIIMISKENLYYNMDTFMNEHIHCINALIYENPINFDLSVPKYFDNTN